LRVELAQARIRRHVVCDLAACRPLPQASFLLKGLGWSGMPLHAVRKDLEERRLSVLPIEDGLILPMSAVWQTKSSTA
jgi:DNA-binding transcriptional LysR family regulator